MEEAVEESDVGDDVKKVSQKDLRPSIPDEIINFAIVWPMKKTSKVVRSFLFY